MKMIALITTVCFSGCSFVAVRGPGDTFREIQECTENTVAPAFDAVGADPTPARSEDWGNKNGLLNTGDF